MNIKKEIQDELEKISPLLSKMKKEDSFQVPSGYFDQLSESVLLKAKQQSGHSLGNTTSPWFKSFFDIFEALFTPRIVTGFATVAVLLLAGWFYFGNEASLVGEEQYLTEISPAELQLYLSENIDEIDDELILELSDNVSDFDFVDSIELDDEELEEWIDEQGDDIIDALL